MRCIFLLGAHRSGTTWLHQLLASCPQVAFLSYGDIRRHLHTGSRPLGEEELERDLHAAGKTRGFDGIDIGVELPEEYGFVLEKPVFGFYANRPISNTDFEPLRHLISRKCQENPDCQFLVLKNPVDFYDGGLRLVEAFPDSVWVCLHRHPWAVFRSQMHAWRQLADQPNGYLASLDRAYARLIADPIQRTALRFFLRQRVGLETILLTLADGCDYQLAHHDVFEAAGIRLRYEDLCRDPGAQLRHLGERLGLPNLPDAPASLRPQARELQEDPMLQDVFKAYAHRFESYCAWLGYTLTCESSA